MPLDVALKEWAAICSALERGRQIVLLRKGGIYEAAGEFELEHREFLLFPTYLHQSLRMLKAEVHGGFEARSAEPAQIHLSAVAVVSDIVRLSSRPQMDLIDDQHIWSPALIDMRFNYRPANPLYLLLVRAYRLPQVAMIQNTPAYAGCKSWVPLEQQIDIAGSEPVLPEDQYQARRQMILEQLCRR